MSPADMIEALNGDLTREYQHFHFYLNAAMRVQTLHREQVRKFLIAEASGEMLHIQEFGDLIVGLGGVPTTKVNGFRSDLVNPKDILSYALQIEEEVVTNYVIRKQQAQKLGGIMGARIEVFIDQQIQNSGNDADHIRSMLAGI